MTKDEALKLALEALEKSARNWPSDSVIEAITALRQSLEQPADEPVAWLCRRKTGGSLFAYTKEQLHELGYGNISVPPFDKIAPLYTAPSHRKPLTDEELFKIAEIAWRHGWASCRDAEYLGEEAEDERWGMVGAEVVQDIAAHGIKGEA